MIKRVSTAVGIALVLSASTASAQAFTSAVAFFGAAGVPTYTEKFEVVPVTKDAPHPSFSQAGITYKGLAGVPSFNVWVSSPGYTNYGAGLNPTTTSILTSNGDEDFLISFLTPQYAVGFDIYTNGLGPTTTRFYNGLTLLGSITYVGGAILGYNGFVSSGPLITSVQFTSTLGGTLNTGIDNLSIFDAPVATVPEPSAIILLATGLVGALAIRRRR